MLTQYVQEAAAKLAPRNADGSYPVVIITEGVGSSGIYPAELMSEESAALFENVPSFMNHPIYVHAPHERDVMTIGGRIKNLRAGVSEGKAALLGDYLPRKEYAEFVAEFADVLALSIFSLASGSKNEEGVLVVEAFAPIDPYRSVDVVVAGGRGGKFSRAQESLRSIESSLGVPEGAQPGAASAPGTQTQEEHMDKELLAALESLKASVAEALTELKAATEAARQAEADAKAATEETSTAVETAVESLKAISDADLIDELAAPLIESAKAGKDITDELAKAVVIKEAFDARDAKRAEDGFDGIVIESADAGATSGDFSLGLGGR